MPVVWRYTDGKPGHENQTFGLIQALSEHLDIQVCELAPLSPMQALWSFISGRYPKQTSLSDPWLVIGAGHATHLSILAARRVTGARSIVLMKPSLPTSWFDLCIVPQHDRPREDSHILLTRGVLNRISPAKHREPGSTLIMVGGPSSHYDWHDDKIIEQIKTIADKAGHRCTVAGSRRTPAELADSLSRLGNIDWVAAEQTDANWLPEQLDRAESIWISEDSVSMIYEALSAGTACGLIEVTRNQPDRITAGVDRLVEDRMLVTYSQWQQGQALRLPPLPLNEAARCAQWVLQKWPVKN
ncbi:MAG TPA: nucleoside-diphosphate sugar epimerase [Gammaproteobacteria bacterium]|nr:nucleoside-diphosphate sugar epimerase [Gammaproteobacteria bacterium]